MGWFDEQVRQVKKDDQEVFEDSIFRMASVVLGKHDSDLKNDERIITKEAIDEILKYFHYKPVDVPDSIKERNDQMVYALRQYGIMHRAVELKENWYKDSFGPVLAHREEDGLPVALLPKKYMGYYYKDPETGEKKNLNRKNAKEFKEDAYTFYRPFPARKLGIKDLLVYMKNCIAPSDIAVFIILTVMVSLVGMLTPYATKILTGSILESGNTVFLAGIAVFLICASASSMLLGSVKSLSLNRIQTKISLGVEAAMISRVMNLPAGFFRKYSAGELSSRVGSANSLCKMILDNIFSGSITSLVSLIYITQIFQYAPQLVLPSIVIIFASIVISIMAALIKTKISRESMAKTALNEGLSFGLINGVQKVKLAGAEKRAFAKWARSYADAAKYTYDIPLFLKVNPAILRAVTLGGTIVLYFLAVKSEVAPSDYLAFHAAYGALIGAFNSLTGAALTIAEIKPVYEMTEPILKAEPESTGDKTTLTSISGNIELSNVYFRYNEKSPYIVDGMSLKIKAGEYIAIVGPTGCGKSTLMRLLLGFETPEKGAIYYDNRDMSTIDLQSLRQKIGAVTQDGGLFQGDIYSNIVISAPHLKLEDAWNAAEIAGIADDIREMPMGMNTIISEGQGGISGGQKQRLMIARAVAPKPKILMFDEATSALDNKTQKQVSEALDGLKCTRIVIAHRLSTIKHCDRILVLGNGKIKEDGTYDELIAKNGIFAELVERQRLDLN